MSIFILGKYFGCCIITYFEHVLDSEKVPNYKVSYTQMMFGKLFGDKALANKIFKSIIIFNFSVLLLKIVYLSKNNIMGIFQSIQKLFYE
jgi:hypothetical protein